MGEILAKFGSAFTDIEGEPRWNRSHPEMFNEEMKGFFKKCHAKPEMGLQCLYHICRGLSPAIWEMRKAEAKRWREGEDDGEEMQKKRRQNLIFFELLFDTLCWAGFVTYYKAKELRENKIEERKQWVAALRYTGDSIHTVGLQLLASAKGLTTDGGVRLSDRIAGSAKES